MIDMYEQLVKQQNVTSKIIDFRSDTVTKPTPDMARAIVDAIMSGNVGDDEYDADNVVHELQKKAVEITGMEDALFVPSGLMANQIAILVHTERTSDRIIAECRKKNNINYNAPIERGGAIILGHHSHIATWEVGAPSILAGVIFRTVRNSDDDDYTVSGEDVRRNYRVPSIWYPTTKLLCLENSLINGKVVSIDKMRDACEAAQEKDIPIHLDGARIFNAATRLLEIEKSSLYDFGMELLKKKTKQILEPLGEHGSLMFCLSKGLSSPVGSILCGNKEFILKARSYRKLLGGGLRQSGVLAACGIVSLDKMITRLYEDHKNARYLAKLLKEALGTNIEVNIDEIETNMVFCKLFMNNPRNDENLVASLRAQGIEISGKNPDNKGRYRFVTHNDICAKDIEHAVEAISEHILRY